MLKLHIEYDFRAFGREIELFGFSEPLVNLTDEGLKEIAHYVPQLQPIAELGIAALQAREHPEVFVGRNAAGTRTGNLLIELIA